MKAITRKFELKVDNIEKICKESDSRKGIIIYNESMEKIFLFFGDSTEYAFVIPPCGYWESSSENFVKSSLSIKVSGRVYNQHLVRVTVFK